MVDRSSLKQNTALRQNAFRILTILLQQNPEPVNIFKLDNTNTIESYFNVIKGRITKQVPRLVDVYNSVSYTETASLSRINVVSPDLPDTIVNRLLNFLSPDVLNVMTLRGIESFLEALIDKTINILTDDKHIVETTNEVERLIVEGAVVERFGWMPDGWVISERDFPSCHEVVHSDDSNVPLNEGVLFLEPFIDLATRSAPIFQLIQNALTSLYELTDGEPGDNARISFRLLKNEFEKFVKQAEEHADMKRVLSDLFDSLKRVAERRTNLRGFETRKQSIVDPGFVRVCGPPTTSTSAKVNGNAVHPKTKLVEHLKPRACVELKGGGKNNRKNVCSICLGQGHQARTCPDILRDTNGQRATKFFRLLIAKGKDADYMKGVMKRMCHDDVKGVADLLERTRVESAVEVSDSHADG
mgnify:CR=1 FL=1